MIGTDLAKNKRIPSLDGLRAIAVSMVILDHTRTAFLAKVPHNDLLRNGRQGVGIFFVLSGFLITNLLIQELDSTKGINLRRFYFRRSFRIFPPFYAYLGIVAALTAFHVVNVRGSQLLCAATYIWDYYRPNGGTWYLGHLWSLAIEEQFYLIWPACMAFVRRETALRIALALILLSPLLRAFEFVAFPSMRPSILITLHTQTDPLMVGCALALANKMKFGGRL